MIATSRMSGTSLNDERFLEFLIAQLAVHDLTPGAICFEITETAAIADDAFEAFLGRVRPGVSGWELNAVIEQAIRERGTRDALIFISAGAYFLERPTAARVADGDLLTVYIEIVGPTGYWVLGDAPEHSTDSRHFGPVHALVGRAVWRVRPWGPIR